MTRTNKFNVLLVVRSSGRHSLDEELAGTFHFYALLDVNGLFGFRDSVTHHPCGGASCRGAGSGVFTIRVDRSGAKAHAGITSVPGDIVEASVVPLAFQVGIHFAQVETQGLQSAKLLEWHDGERQQAAVFSGELRRKNARKKGDVGREIQETTPPSNVLPLSRPSLALFHSAHL